MIDVVMVVFLLITLFPIFWMVYCSFKDNTDILTGKIWPSRAPNDIVAIEREGSDVLLCSADGRITRTSADLKREKSFSVKSFATSFAFDDRSVWIASANKGLSKVQRADLRKVASYSYQFKKIDPSKVASSVILKEGDTIWVSLEMRDFDSVLEFDTKAGKFTRLIDIQSDLSRSRSLRWQGPAELC